MLCLNIALSILLGSDSELASCIGNALRETESKNFAVGHDNLDLIILIGLRSGRQDVFDLLVRLEVEVTDFPKTELLNFILADYIVQDNQLIELCDEV